MSDEKATNISRDHRMQWILLLEENSQHQGRDTYFTDYEICSEVRIPGVLDYGDGSLLCGLLSEVDENGLYSYTIRIKQMRRDFVPDFDAYTKDGYYFQGGVIGELMAVFSVYFQARLFLRSVTSGELTPTSIQTRDVKPFRYIKPNKGANSEMFSDQDRNWAHEDGLCAFLDKIRNLDQGHHRALIQAFRWYSEAVKEIGCDHEIFYIRMVSAAEALLDDIPAPDDNLSRQIQVCVDTGELSEPEKQELQSWLRHRKIQKRFLLFIRKYSEGFFPAEDRQPARCFIKEDVLEDYLKRIYSARSEYLHRGKPMYISQDMRGDGGSGVEWDLCPSCGMMSDRKLFGGDEKLPRARWFERLVNHCLRAFIEEHLPTPITSSTSCK